MRTKVYIDEAGCNRRRLDLEAIRRYLLSNGYEMVDRPQDADKIIVATCAFKKLEEDESIQRLRHFRKYGSATVVYGCLPDIAKERYQEFADLPNVAPRDIQKIELLFPPKRNRFSAIPESNRITKTSVGIFKAVARFVQTRPTLDRELWHRTVTAGRKRIADFISPPPTPYYLFASRGCVGKCSYCAIRNSIGSVRSKPIDAVVAEFRQGVADGYRDFTILGDDPGCYGIDRGSSLPDLLHSLFEVCTEVEGSGNGEGAEHACIAFHVNEIHPRFLISYAERFLAMDHFSSVRSILCPIQSGSSRILQLMQREHTAEQLEEVVKSIQARHPEIEFNTQIIIGFPSEREEEFQRTLDFVVRCRFNSVVVFPYDDKDGTASSHLQEKIPEKVVQGRVRKAFRFFARAGVSAYYKCP